MRVFVLAVGSELLGHGRTDTNSLWLARELAELGLSLTGKAVVGDDPAAIARAVKSALDSCDLLIVSGGLGPTADDLTREAVSAALELPLRHDERVAEAIRTRFADYGVDMAEVNLRQAQVPEGAEVLDNPRGTAPGLRLQTGTKVLYLLPGVPGELRGLARDYLLPWLARNGGGRRREVRTFRVACLPEATVEQRLAPLYGRLGSERVSVLARPGDVRVEVRGGADLGIDLAWMCNVVGDAVYSDGPSMPQVVLDLCRDRGLRLAAAESCTGGDVCRRLTQIPGSSDVLLGGVVAYDNAIKRDLLGVRARSLDAFGAVSEEVAVEMADGVRRRLGADLGVSATGIAGPGGGSDEKPVGTVWLAWSRTEWTDAMRVRIPGGREQVRLTAVQWALDGVRRRVALR